MRLQTSLESKLRQIDLFFNPKSIAVVGASRHVNKAGNVIFSNFAANKRRGVFRGELYPINPNEDSILGFKCYPSLKRVPGDVESAVIVIPSKCVPDVMREAGVKGVSAVTIISAGFGEVGNHQLEKEVMQIAEEYGMRVLGPNCLGVFDSYTGVDMLFLPETKVVDTGDIMVATPRPMQGSIAFVSQSGGFGAAALDYLTGNQIGISKFVSFGNKIDIAEPEILAYLGADERTRAILLYVESIDEGREFMDAAKDVTRCKPIVALKSGRTMAGSRAAASHTGAMSGAGLIYDAAFSQVGVIKSSNMLEFFNVGKALAFQPPARGRNTAIVTDAGGPGVMAADECESRGINVKVFSDETSGRFEKLIEDGVLPPFIQYKNPVDLTGSATSQMFEEAMKIVIADDEVHGVIVIGIHHLPAIQEDFVERVAKVSAKALKPIVACDIGETEMALYIRSKFEKLGIPAYRSPEEAAQAMAALVSYGDYLSRRGCFDDYVERFIVQSRKVDFNLT
ncbi:MAG: acetate--CoA ligase family protein [Candidatus Bathyarchaeia archaeon]